MTHVTLPLLALGLLLAVPARAQQPRPALEPLSDYTLLIDSLTQHLDKTKVPAGILYDRALGLSRLGTFTATVPSSGTHFQQSYLDLAQSAYSKPASLLPHTQRQLSNLANQELRGGNLPIGVLDARFGVLDTLAIDRGSLTEANGLYYDGPNQAASAYTLKRVVVVSPLADTTGYTNTFTLPPSLVLQNTGRQLRSVQVQVDNLSFTLLPGGRYTGTFYWGGNKTLRFTTYFSDGSSAQAVAALYVRPTVAARTTSALVLPITPNIIGRPWTNYYGFSTYGEGQAQAYFNHPDSKTDFKLRNPIIVIDGYDPGDRRKIEGIAAMFGTLLDELGKTPGRERDVVILNFPTSTRPITYLGATYPELVDGGADFIERNGLVLVELLNRLKPLMQDPNQKVTVMGPSMGGLISRYGLALMEKNYAAGQGAYWQHNVDTWISLDAPHGGANVPLGVQYFLKYFSRISIPAFANDERITSVAAQQMLVNHAADLNGDYFRKPFMRSLLNNGLPGSQGFPTLLRRVGMTDGTLGGNLNTSLGYSGQSGIQLDVVRNGASGSRSFFYRSTQPGAQISADMYFSPGAGQTGAVFDGQARAIVALFRPVARRSHKEHTSNVNGSYDLAPGDLFNSQQQVRDQTVNGPQRAGYSYQFTALKPYHCFIPTVSALAFQYRNTAAYDGSGLLPNPYTNLAARQLGCNDETPFDAIYADPTVNSPHVSLSGGQQFLMRELYNVAQPARFAAGNPIALCSNATATLTLADCAARSGLAFYDWSLTGPAVFDGTGTAAAVNGGLSQVVRSTGSGQIMVSVVVRRPGASPSPATNYYLLAESGGWVDLASLTNGGEVCIGSMVTVTATPRNGASITNWRVDNGSLGYVSGNEVSVQVSNSPGTTTLYADYDSSCPGGPSGTSGFSIQVVSNANGFYCAFRTAGPAQPAVFPIPADAYVDIRSPFATARPYRIELFNERGVQVYAETARATEARIVTRAFPVGLYHLTLREGNDTRRYNLSIQR